jgi:hypothetical protein
MSHCCGGCGGEGPSKKKAEVVDQMEEQVSSESTVDAKAAKKDTEVGMWQPAKK